MIKMVSVKKTAAHFWLERKKASLCILAGICAAALFVIINSAEKINGNKSGAYVVRIRHYGINAAEMERSVTIPMEDALYSIPGIMSVQSYSENSLSNVYMWFKPGGRGENSSRGRYEAVRDAVQAVYETLSPAAQRPEILNSGSSRIPVWSAAVVNSSYNSSGALNENALSAHITEKIVKPALESLEGAAEVLVGGTGLKEIYITFDQEKLDMLSLEPSAAASFIAMNDSIFSGGAFLQSDREVIVSVDGRYDKLDTALIPAGDGRFIELSDIAHVSEREREPDILSRLNGRKTVSIAVMGRHGADLRKLSSQIKKELENLSLPVEFIVLSDLGAEEAVAFRSVLYAALSGALMVALISFILNRKNNTYIAAFFCALAIPAVCLISAAVLSAAGLTVDRLLLAGIAAGLGTAIDAVILCSERLRKCSGYDSALTALSRLTGPLIAGGATTAAALVPLYAIGQPAVFNDASVSIIAASITVVTIVSLIISLTLLPPLLLWRLSYQKKYRPSKPNLPIMRFLFHKLCRLLAGTVRFCVRYSAAVIIISAAVIITAVILLCAKGVDTGGYGSEDSVYGQVEFSAGLLAEEADRLLSIYSSQLSEIDGVKNIETGARTGSGIVLISFDPKKTQAHIVRESAKKIFIPGGFVFFQENSLNDRYWEIIVYGDENNKCREIAEELAFSLNGHPLIRELVFNFKDGNRKMTLIPDREILAGSNISFSATAARARLGVFGPVGYKRMEADGETDVRIRINENVTRQSREGVLNLLVPAVNREAVSSLQINTVMRINDDTEPSSIRRDNRRRSASITISTKPMDPRRVKQQIAGLLNKLDLPPGYSVEFDPEAVKQSEGLSSAVISLIAAVIFCYMIIAAVNESFKIPFLVLAAVPPSLAIPALCLALSGVSYNSAAACAFIAVSGMTVNAAILCVDGLRARVKTKSVKNIFSIYSALRGKMPALLATTGTTIAGAVPFLFLTEGANTLIRTLSLVGALGVAGSFICSVTVIPAIFALLKNNNTHKTYSAARLVV